ncbi:MAG: hypothetical protein WC389_00150 [Lutibacter sp.]|jgi:hypothetical protein
MTTLKIGQTVYTTSGIEGTIVENQGMFTLVNVNGETKKLMTMILKSKPVSKKVKSYMKEETKEVINFNSIVNNLEGTSKMRNSFTLPIYNEIEKLADSKNHFAGSIIEDARNGKKISKKQAQVVAFFAKENGLI